MKIKCNILSQINGYTVFHVSSIEGIVRGKFQYKHGGVVISSNLAPGAVVCDAEVRFKIWGRDGELDFRPIVVTDEVWVKIECAIKHMNNRLKLKLLARTADYFVVEVSRSVKSAKFNIGELIVASCDHPGYSDSTSQFFVHGANISLNNLPVVLPTKWFDTLKEYFTNEQENPSETYQRPGGNPFER